jgi:hypothetical protein
VADVFWNRPWVWSVLGPALLCLAMAGCSSQTPPTAGGLPQGVPARPEATTPAAHSGDLTRESLPHPQALGAGWDYRVDPGSVEDGYAGNGTPAMSRDPHEVAAVLTPLGCRPVRLPVPDAALEVTYGHPDGTPAVGLLLRFADAEQADSFFVMRARAMRDCVGWSRAQADVTVLRDSPTSFVSVRDEHVGGTPLWTEGVRRDGADVLFVAVAGGDGGRVVASALA